MHVGREEEGASKRRNRIYEDSEPVLRAHSENSNIHRDHCNTVTSPSVAIYIKLGFL